MKTSGHSGKLPVAVVGHTHERWEKWISILGWFY